VVRRERDSKGNLCAMKNSKFCDKIKAFFSNDSFNDVNINKILK
jgi:hypothetical protein